MNEIIKNDIELSKIEEQVKENFITNDEFWELAIIYIDLGGKLDFIKNLRRK